jgi:hypothetical protein
VWNLRFHITLSRLIPKGLPEEGAQKLGRNQLPTPVYVIDSGRPDVPTSTVPKLFCPPRVIAARSVRLFL